MSDSTDLLNEEATPEESKSRLRIVFASAVIVLVGGGVVVWLSLRTPEPIVELPEELVEIPAAKAPPIVPSTGDVTIDVPIASDIQPEDDPDIEGPSYIPPASDGIPLIPEPLETPIVNLMETTANEEQRSRLLDALNADPAIDFEPIENEDEPDTISSTSAEIEELNHTLIPGSVIPSVLLQGINTDLPGIAVAQVSRDVYDSKTGAMLLIPRGSRIFGTYGTGTLESDERVLVNWERIDLPNGNSIEFSQVIGADQSGNAGMKDQVHRRTGRALTVTGLTSLITAGLTHAANANDPAVLRETGEGRFVQEPSYAGEATRQIAQQYGNLVGQIAQRHLDRAPTLTVRPGYEFVIQIAEEISLSPYLP